MTAIVKANIANTNTAGKTCVSVGDLENPLWLISILFNYVCYCDYLGPLESTLFYISNIKLENIELKWNFDSRGKQILDK